MNVVYFIHFGSVSA